MIPYFNKNEAEKRMQRRNSTMVRWTLQHQIVEWRYISATAAKNFDGSPAGDGNNPNQTILQRMIWTNGESPRFTNWW